MDIKDLIIVTGGAKARRQKLKTEFWADDHAWTGENEKGWFRAPRTLPLILKLLSSKDMSGNSDPSRVYIDLLARHRDSGLVEMSAEGDHAYAVGYTDKRGIRTWQERMKLLEELGFIKSKAGGIQLYRYVLLVHPAIAVKHLRDSGKVPDRWWDMYRAMQIESKETQHENFAKPAETPVKAGPIRTTKSKSNYC